MQVINTYIGNDGRERAYCRDENGKAKIVSYPRILMEEKLGRPLEPYEDVHHKDENKLNNNIENLELINHGMHQRQHSKKYYDKIAICEVCGKEFVWKDAVQRRYYIDIKRGKSRLISCSKRCSAYYGRMEQLGRNSLSECGLNGETLPNGNTVPNTKMYVRREYTPTIQNG